jgi:zinc protease
MPMKRWTGALALLGFVVMGTNGMAQPKIEQITTPKGITVWLVESHQIPMVSAEVDFRAGSAYDPAGKDGLANFTASLLDEGAGKLDAFAYKQALEDIGARLSPGADTTDLSVTLTTLTEHAGRAFELLGLALREPRFDAEAATRIRLAILTGLKRAEENPSTVAGRAFGPALFGNHPYAHPASGTQASVAKLGAQMAREFWARNITRANMVVSVVGDIDAATVARLVDASLGDLSAGTARNPDPAAPTPAADPAPVYLKRPVPQAAVLLGQYGLPRTHPDYWNLLVANEVLGGGVLSSRLFHSVREKHGLAYDVRSMNVPLPNAGEWFVSLQTGVATVQQALDLSRAEIEKMRTKPVGVQEFKDVIDYLVGSFPLRMDSNNKILGYLTVMQMEKLGPDYLRTWTDKVKAVKRADITRVAKTYWHPDRMALVVVGDGPALKAR